MVRSFFAFQLRHRFASLIVVLLITGALGSYAGRVRPDYSIEQFFPVWAEARQTYDRLKKAFPSETAQAIVIVEAPDIFTREGLARMARLEAALVGLPYVVEVKGLTSIDDIRGDGDIVRLQRLVPRDVELTDEVIANIRHIATTDPLFASRLARPDGKVAAIEVKLEPEAADRDESRQEFTNAAEAVLARESTAAQPAWKLTASGLPAVRAQYVRLLNAEMPKLMPLALLSVLVLLFLTYRRVGIVMSAFATLLVSLTWSMGVLGALDFPSTLMASVLPIVVIIISLSDTVHIATEFIDGQRAGKSRDDALLDAMAHSAMPCLATEVVLACGFLSLIAVNINAIYEFGTTAAISMILTWLANMTLLPFALSLTKPLTEAQRSTASSPWLAKKFEALIEWIARAVDQKPKLVVSASVAVLGLAGLAVFGVHKQSYIFDDLKPGTGLQKSINYMEREYGGIVPISIYIESTTDRPGSTGADEGAILHPSVVATLDRATKYLRTFPEVTQATSLADYVGKAHRILTAGSTAATALPETTSALAQEIFFVDDGDVLDHVLSSDRRSTVALGFARDPGSKRISEMFATLEEWVAKEQTRLDAETGPNRFRIHATGNLRIFKAIDDMLVGGLIGSFGATVLLTIALFCVVLRSWKLGLIGLIPNLSPMLLVFALMAALDIRLRPATVICFSIILVIADDDTIQYLARLRAHYADAKLRLADMTGVDLHREAALSCLRSSGTPMLINSTAVSAGFLLLLLSSFKSTADLGVLIGATLFAAVFADLFLAPILIMKLRPNLEK